jgi:dTDP-4-dehydrorhamnose 3,5-epimerase
MRIFLRKLQVWIPPGFTHGFLVRSQSAEFLYKGTDYYAPQHERAFLWNDADLAITWEVTAEPVLSERDGRAPRLLHADLY